MCQTNKGERGKGKGRVTRCAECSTGINGSPTVHYAVRNEPLPNCAVGGTALPGIGGRAVGRRTVEHGR